MRSPCVRSGPMFSASLAAFRANNAFVPAALVSACWASSMISTIVVSSASDSASNASVIERNVVFPVRRGAARKSPDAMDDGPDISSSLVARSPAKAVRLKMKATERLLYRTIQGLYLACDHSTDGSLRRAIEPEGCRHRRYEHDELSDIGILYPGRG